MTRPSPRPISAIRLDGGRLCIDFANSIHDRFAAIAEDYLATPDRYEEWARRTGALQADEAIALPQTDAARAGLMTDIRALRAVLFGILAAQADHAALPASALKAANSWLLKARQDQQLASDGQLLLRTQPGDPHLPLKRIALDLVDTLALHRTGRLTLKHCANQSSCGWLFADTSKNGRRRWCSMQTCGVASKMFAMRQRNASDGALAQ